MFFVSPTRLSAAEFFCLMDYVQRPTEVSKYTIEPDQPVLI